MDIQDIFEVEHEEPSPDMLKAQNEEMVRKYIEYQALPKIIEALEATLNDEASSLEDKISANIYLSQSHARLGQMEQVMTAHQRSLELGTPRAEICFDIGSLYKNFKDFDRARKWFEKALLLEPPLSGFKIEEMWGFRPAMELFNLSFQEGDTQKAYEYHRLAKSFDPDHEAVLNNERYFRSLGF